MLGQGVYTITENVRLAKKTYRMILAGDTKSITAPGQFVNIKLAGKYLRRPISICDYDDSSITIIYKAVGSGTEQMSRMQKGEKLDLLTGLGNGFSVEDCGVCTLLVGGGVGVPPLYGLAKELIAQGKKCIVVLGFGSVDEVFYLDEFLALSCDTVVTTVDGSMGLKGFVTTAIEKFTVPYDHYCTCGPLPMLKAVHSLCGDNGQLSFESRMGCGFGGCMGCSCKTITGYKRICREGPIMKGGELIW